MTQNDFFVTSKGEIEMVLRKMACGIETSWSRFHYNFYVKDIGVHVFYETKLIEYANDCLLQQKVAADKK